MEVLYSLHVEPFENVTLLPLENVTFCVQRHLNLEFPGTWLVNVQL